MMNNRIYFKKVRPTDPVFTPTKRDGDADYDLYAAASVLIKPGGTLGVSTNLALELPEGWEGKVEEKSGLALNSHVAVLGGVIDNSYRGEVLIIVHNLGKTSKMFRTGEKVAQLKIRPVTPDFEFIETKEELSETERGDKGFGSTGL